MSWPGYRAVETFTGITTSKSPLQYVVKLKCRYHTTNLPFLAMCSRVTVEYVLEDTCTEMFTTVLCLIGGEGINLDIHQQENIYIIYVCTYVAILKP